MIVAFGDISVAICLRTVEDEILCQRQLVAGRHPKLDAHPPSVRQICADTSSTLQPSRRGMETLLQRLEMESSCGGRLQDGSVPTKGDYRCYRFSHKDLVSHGRR